MQVISQSGDWEGESGGGVAGAGRGRSRAQRWRDNHIPQDKNTHSVCNI